MAREYDRTAIRRLRKELGLTLSEFGSRIGMRNQEVSSLERRPGLPNVRTILKIANEFGVSESYFFKDDSPSTVI